MSLRRRCFLALSFLAFGAAIYAIHAQESGGPALHPSAPRTNEPPLLTRTSARKTAVVAAVERVRNATVNIHSERSIAAANHDVFAMPASPKAMNGMAPASSSTRAATSSPISTSSMM